MHPFLSCEYVFVFAAILCYYSFSCACITHNSLHTRVFHSRTLETIYHQILTLTYGHPAKTMVRVIFTKSFGHNPRLTCGEQIPGHNLSHHRHTETRKDPMRTSKVQYKWHILNLLLFQPTVALDVFIMDIRYTLLQRILQKPFFVNVCCEWTVLIVSQFSLMLLDWRRFLLYIYIPHLFAQWAIVTMNILQHDGCEDDLVLNYNTARNFTGRTINLLTFNNGFHTIHHMFPTMHWSELREQNNKKIKKHIHPNLDQACMATYIFRTFLFPGHRIDYLGQPVKFAIGTYERDEDWTQEHAPQNVKLADYDCSLLRRVLFR